MDAQVVVAVVWEAQCGVQVRPVLGGVQLPHESLCEGAQVLTSSCLSFLNYCELFELDCVSGSLTTIKCSDSTF